jgi:hypothetical protein
VYSGGEKLLANLASVGAATIKTNPPNSPPSADAEIAMPIASEARPLCAIGYPSNSVAAASGVPGIRSRIAEIDPPHDPPTKMEIRNPIAGMGGSEIAAGNKRMMPIRGPSPGSAPTRRPIMMPRNISPIDSGVKNNSKPYRNDSKGITVSPRDV